MNSNLQPETTQGPYRRSRFGLGWAINLTLLVLICWWIISDGRSLGTIESWPKSKGMVGGLVQGAIYGSLVGIFLGLFSGPKRHRSVKAWLAFTALLSVWCTLFVSWRSLYYFGQSIRIERDIRAYEPLIQELRIRWPSQEGRSRELGYYLAYPLDKPRTLQFPGGAKVSDAAPIAAVERSDRGALRLQLAGAETGAWLEWHPEGSTPDSFTGGLWNRYELLRTTNLQPDWYLTRYRER